MPRKKCMEKTKDNQNAENAVWVANENGNQLYYPSVHTCVTVTLVFENGLLGGHASQVPPREKADPQPKENLKEVIEAMMGIATAGKAPGALKRIYYFGFTEGIDWGLDDATKTIESKFGKPSDSNPIKTLDYSSVDIVFDITDKEVYWLGTGLIDRGKSEDYQVNEIKSSGRQFDAHEKYSG
jgi:hypothetical protein